LPLLAGIGEVVELAVAVVEAVGAGLQADKTNIDTAIEAESDNFARNVMLPRLTH
jgi:hypothetical protein